MLNLDFCQFKKLRSGRITAPADFMDEGQVLVIDGQDERGHATVRPSNGTTDQVFYGISIFERQRPLRMPIVNFTVIHNRSDGSERAYLDRNYIENSLYIYGFYGSRDVLADTRFFASSLFNPNDVTNGYMGAWGSSNITASYWPTTALKRENGVPYVDGSDFMDWDSTPDYAVIWLRYSFAPTPLQSWSLNGTTSPNNNTLYGGSRIAAVSQGRLFVSNYYTQHEYQIGSRLGMGSNGLVGLSGESGIGSDIPHSNVIHVPTPENPFLGFEITNR